MSRKAAVNQEAVNKTCEQLQDENKAVTVNAVINIIGGSFSTVGEKVKLWKEEQTARTMPIIDMPETVTQAIQRAAVDIWGAASVVAGETVERIQSEAGEAITKAKSELSEYMGEVSRLENELEQSHIKAVDGEKLLSDTLAQVNSLNTVKTTLETRVTDKSEEIDRIRSDYERLQAELSQGISKVSKLETKLEQAIKSGTENKAELSKATAKITEINQINGTLKTEVKQAQENSKRLQAELVKIGENSDTLSKANIRLETRLTGRDDEVKELKANYKQLQLSHEKLQAELVLIAKTNKAETKPSIKK